MGSPRWLGYRRGDLAGALALVALALLCRLPRLTQTPGWDGDEGYNLDIAWHLLHGRAQFFALEYAFVQHPILTYALVAPLLGVAGRELWVLRAVTAVAGSLAVGVLYLTVVATGSRRSAVLGALALAGAHFVVAYNRLGYTYNLLLLLSALTLWCVVRWEAGVSVGSRATGVQGAVAQPPESRHDGSRAGASSPVSKRGEAWLWGAAGAAALGLLTDQVGIALPLFVAARAWPERRLAVLVLATGILPAALAGAGAWAWHGEAFFADWRHTLVRVGIGGLWGGVLGEGAPGAVPLPSGTALARWVVNYFHLLRAEWWWPAAVAGLFCIRPLAARRRLLTLAALLALPIFALRDLAPFFRTGIPLLLPAAWGLGALLDAGMTAAYETVERDAPDERRGTTSPLARRLAGAGLAALVVLLPLGLELGRTAGGLGAGFALPMDWALVGNAAGAQRAAREAAAHVNARTGPRDVVVVSPHVAWLYRAQVADFLQSVAAGGEAIAFYPAGLPPHRFRFDPSPAGMHYAVLDDYWHRWAAESGPVRRLVMEVDSWPLEWQSADVRVYRRPDSPPSSAQAVDALGEIAPRHALPQGDSPPSSAQPASSRPIDPPSASPPRG